MTVPELATLTSTSKLAGYLHRQHQAQCQDVVQIPEQERAIGERRISTSPAIITALLAKGNVA